MPTKFPHALDPMPHPGKPNKLLTFSFGGESVSEHDSNQKIASDTAGYIQEALEGLETTIGLLNVKKPSQPVLQCLEEFFFTKDTAACKTISAKYELIKTGLHGNQRIKIGKIPFKDQSTFAAGAVKIKTVFKNGMKDYYTTPGNNVYGAMYFDGDSIGGGTGGARLVVHEASHKYADTSDYFYIEGVGLSTTDFNIHPTAIFKKTQANVMALSNADSYAWMFLKLSAYRFG